METKKSKVFQAYSLYDEDRRKGSLTGSNASPAETIEKNPLSESASVEFAPPAQKDEQEPSKNASTPEDEKRAGAADLQDVSRDHIEIITTPKDIMPPREIDTSLAKKELGTEMEETSIEVLSENNASNTSADNIKISQAEEFEINTILNKGFLDKPENTPVEKDLTAALIQRVDEEMVNAAVMLKEQEKDSDQEKLKRFQDALTNLAQRVEDTIKTAGDELEENLKKLLEEIATVGSKEWEERFVAKEDGINTETPPHAQEPVVSIETAPKEPATTIAERHTPNEPPDTAEKSTGGEEILAIKNIAGATYKALEDLQLPIGRLLVPEKQELENEFHALGERMVKIVNAGEEGKFSLDDSARLQQEVETLKQKVASYAEKETAPVAETQKTNAATPVDAEEKEQEIKTETDAISQFENLPPEQKLTIFQTISKAGFTVEKWKNEKFAAVFGLLAGGEETHARDKTLKRFLNSTKDIFERDAKRSEQSIADLQVGKEALLRIPGTNIKADITAFRGCGFLWGNLMKYGRSIIGPFQGWNLLLMGANIGLESAKEARLANEDVIEKTRIQDIDQAREVARKIYKEAQEKAGAGNSVSKETLEKAYQEGIPGDLLDRLAKNIEPGVENRFWQKVLQKDMQGTVEKIEAELAKIDSDESLSDQARNARKDAYLNNWFTRSQRLKDFDRIVSQNGEIDALASLARYGEVAAKTAVYAMMADSMRRVGMKLAEFFSSSDGVETITSAVPLVTEHTATALPKNTLTDDILNKFQKNHDLPTAATQPVIPTPSTPITAGHEGVIIPSAVKIPESILPQPKMGFSVNHEGTLIPEAVKIPESTLPTQSEMGFSADHGTVVPEAVKIPQEIFPEPQGHGVAEAIISRAQAIENSLHELGKTYTVNKGDTIWGIIKAQLGGNEYWKQLGATPEGVRQQNFILDTMRHDLLNRSQADLIKMGIKSGDINRIYPGDKIDFSKVFDKDELSRIFNRAEHLQTEPAPHISAVPEVLPHATTAPAPAEVIPQPAVLPIKPIVTDTAIPEKLYPKPNVDERLMPNQIPNHPVNSNSVEPLQPKSVGQIHHEVIPPPTGGRFEAFSVRTDAPLFQEYKTSVYSVLHGQRPDIQLPLYDMKLRDFLAQHPNGREELSRIFHPDGVTPPKTLSQETLNGSVLDYWTKQAMQHDINAGHLSNQIPTQIDSTPTQQNAPQQDTHAPVYDETARRIQQDAIDTKIMENRSAQETWANTHAPEAITDPYTVSREQIPQQYTQWVQQGMTRQYPNIPPQFYQQRMVDMMARDGYNNTVDTVNRMSQLFGVRMPVQFIHQHSNDTLLDVGARMAWQTAQGSGHLPPNFPNLPSVFGTLGRFVSPNPTDQSIGVSDVSTLVNRTIGDWATNRSIGHSGVTHK